MISFKVANEAMEYYKLVLFYAQYNPEMYNAVIKYCTDKDIYGDKDSLIYQYAFDNFEELSNKILPKLIAEDKERFESYKRLEGV